MVEHAIVSSCVVEAGFHNVERLTVALLQLLDKCALLVHNQKCIPFITSTVLHMQSA